MSPIKNITKASRTSTNYEIGRQVFENDLKFKQDRRKNIVDQLFQIMKSKHIRGTDVATRIDMADASVSRILAGGQNLTLDTMHKLANSVECDLVIKFVSTTKEK